MPKPIHVPKSAISKKYLDPVRMKHDPWQEKQNIIELCVIHRKLGTPDFLKPLPDRCRGWVVCPECGDCKALVNGYFSCLNGHGKLRPARTDERGVMRLCGFYVKMNLKPRFSAPKVKK